MGNLIYPERDGGKFCRLPDGNLWWLAGDFSGRNHIVTPVIDVRRAEIRLGCQTVTFRAVTHIFWLMVKARVRRALQGGSK